MAHSHKSTESGRYLLEESNPFVHGVELHGPKGETVRLRGIFDDGATINVIDEKTFAMVKHRLNKPNPSDRIMRMARVYHGLPETCGVSKTGHVGTGTVLDFGTPRHTVYPCRSVAGIHGYISKVIRIFNNF
jgi:hypothetical protein